MSDKTPAKPKRPTFPKGNQLWQLRTLVGRDKLFADGATLWAEACQYFAWCDANPWVRPELVKYQGEAEQWDVPLGRPYSMSGLCVYLGVSPSYLGNSRAHLREKVEKGRASEADVSIIECIDSIEQVVRTQNIEGAILNVYNANFTARMHGIADTVNNNGSGEAVIRVTVRDQATADNMDKLEDMLK